MAADAADQTPIEHRKVVTVSSAAKEKLRASMQEHGNGLFVRVGVIFDGPTGHRFDICLEDHASPDDYLEIIDGIQVLVDRAIVPFLEGAVVDWETRPNGHEGFRIDSPHALTIERTSPAVSDKPVKELAVLGNLLARYAPSWINVAAGYVLSALLVCGGFTGIGWLIREIYQAGGDLPINAEKGLSWLFAVLLSILLVGAIIGGVLLFRYVKNLSSLQVSVHAQGIAVISPRESQFARWTQISSINETIIKKYFPLKGIGKRAVPMGETYRYTLNCHDGRTIDIDGNMVPEIEHFRVTLKKSAVANTIAWNISEQDGAFED